MFKVYIAEVETQLERKIKILRSDMSGEYCLNEFDSYCEQHDIMHHRITPFTPQQLGFVEQKNRALTAMINSILIHPSLSNNLWGEALLTTCYVNIKFPSMKSKVTPYEL